MSCGVKNLIYVMKCAGFGLEYTLYIRGMFFNTCHLLDYIFCGQLMRMLFICDESPIFSDQIDIKIIAVRRTVI